MSCFADFAEICRPDAPLGPLTRYRLGGPARWLLTPRSEAELAAVLVRCRESGITWRILGGGSNVLVRDEGVDAAVIRLTGPVWEEVGWDGPRVYAATSVDFPRLVKHSVNRGLLGLENLAGIPGSVGGAVRMNAGGKYGNIARYTRHVRVMDDTGRVSTRPAAEVGFAYRTSDLAGSIVLGAGFALEQGQRDAVRQRFLAICKEKSAAQPRLDQRCAGCVFKNPPGDAAGRLLDVLGLKGLGVGGARISEKHANFIVARAGATAQDVLDLIALARDRVRQSEGIELELEIEIW